MKSGNLNQNPVRTQNINQAASLELSQTKDKANAQSSLQSDHNQFKDNLNDEEVLIENSTKPTYLCLSYLRSTKCQILSICFVCFILLIIFYTIFYQQKTRPIDHDDLLAQQTIFDEPYKDGEEVVQHYDLVLLRTGKALCLNGSPGSYYESRTGDPSRILFYFEGGGWCYGRDDLLPIIDCYQRAKYLWLGGSNTLQPTISHSNNILSKHPNNYFRNWKKIFLNYCDGSGHQGRRENPVMVEGQNIYFRGHDIKVETFNQLERKYGLFSKAQRVVLAGGSAGSLAVMTWANYIYDRVENGRVFAISDAGIFYDNQNKESKRHSYKERLAALMQYTNEQIDPPTPQCIKEHSNQKVNCMLAQHLIKHINPRLFITQSISDSWSLPNIIGVKCLNKNECSAEDNQLIGKNQENVMKLLKEVGSQKKNGVFATSCPLHSLLTDTIYLNEQFTVPLNSSFTVNRAIEQWIKHPAMDNFHLETERWQQGNKGCF